jgi:hypothetical protein
MAYYYQDPNHDIYTYEHVNDGNHSDNGYHDEPDHCRFEDTPEAFKYEHRQPECDGYEPMGHRYEDGEEQVHWEGEYRGEIEGYEHRELKGEGNWIGEAHEHGEPVYDDGDEMLEQEELKHMVHKWGDEPHDLKYYGLEYYGNGTLGTNGSKHEHDNDVHASTPTYVPPIPSPSPPHPSPACTISQTRFNEVM